MTVQQKKSAWKWLALASAVVVAVVLALAINRYERLMRSIMPGSFNSSSTSMEPIELSLSTRYRWATPIPDDAPPLEWRLTLPRAYFRSEIGDSGSVFKSSQDCCDHFIHLEAVFDPETKSLKPATLETIDVQSARGVSINLSNIGQLSEITSGDNCIRGDDFKEFMVSKGNTIDWRRACGPTDRRCRIDTHLDGWYIVLFASREIYESAPDVCTAVRNFLIEHSTKRDDARQLGG